MTYLSYCRFEMTFKELKACHENWNGVSDDNSNEKNYRDKLYGLCKEIADRYEDGDE